MSTKTVPQPEKPGVSLVLGTGLLKCAASIGMMQVLDEEHIRIEHIAASGPGSIFAAAYGLGYSIEKIKTIVQEIASFYAAGNISLRRRLQVMLPGLMRFNRQFGFLDGKSYQDIFRRHFDGRSFSNTNAELFIVTTNFSNGQRMVITDGELWTAIAASCVIPGYIPPMNRDGFTLIGGAVSDPMPLSIATQQGNNVILTMGFDGAYLPGVNSLGAFMYQLNNIHENHLLNTQATLSNLSHFGEIIPVIPQFAMAIGLADAHQLSFIIEKGAEATRAILPHLRKTLEN